MVDLLHYSLRNTERFLRRQERAKGPYRALMGYIRSHLGNKGSAAVRSAREQLRTAMSTANGDGEVNALLTAIDVNNWVENRANGRALDRSAQERIRRMADAA
jgi:hypothetical protein